MNHPHYVSVTMKAPCCWFLESILVDVPSDDNNSEGGRETNSNSRRVNTGDVEEKVRDMSATGVLNPTGCFHLGDVILFTVDTSHYPQYDL